MPRIAEPPTVDLVAIGKSKTWHVAPSGAEPGEIVSTVCGRRDAATDVDLGVDANVVSHRSRPVCAHCRAGGNVLSPKPKALVDLYDDAVDDLRESQQQPTTNEEAEVPKTEKKPRAKKAAAPKKAAGRKPVEQPVERDALKAAIAAAEAKIATQPKRAAVELAPAQAEKAHKLGKAIAADRWLLKKASAGKTSASTVAAIVERIERRVDERNGIRLG